jgi:hypothetical protein
LRISKAFINRAFSFELPFDLYPLVVLMGIDRTLAGLFNEKVTEMGEMGVSGIGDGGGGRVAAVRFGADAGSFSFGFFFSVALRLDERRPEGSDDFAL